MREIKFRAWNVACSCEGCKGIWDWERLQSLTYGKRGNTIFNDKDFILMQYTGLHDKNGKEVFEGDIVKQDLWGIAIVKFGEGANIGGGDSSSYFYGYYLEYKNKKDSLGNNEVDSSAFRDVKNIEVIGNIYENPELLKEN